MSKIKRVFMLEFKDHDKAMLQFEIPLNKRILRLKDGKLKKFYGGNGFYQWFKPDPSQR